MPKKKTDKRKWSIRDKFGRISSFFTSKVQEKRNDIQGLPTDDTLEKHRRTIIKQGRKHLKTLGVGQKKVASLSLVIAFVAFLTLVSGYMYSVYGVVSTSTVTYSISRIVPTNVVIFGNSSINYDEVIFQYRTAQRVQSLNETSVLNTAGLFEQAISKAIENEAIRIIGREQGISIDEEFFAQQLQEPIELAGGEEKFEQSLQDTYGWTKKDFEDEFKVQLTNAAILPSKIFSLRNSVNSGSSFIRTAETLDLDIQSSAPDSDDILPESLQSSAEALEVGSQSLVVSEEGLYALLYRTSPNEVVYVTQSEADKEAELAKFIRDSETYTCLSEGSIGSAYNHKGWVKCIFP